MNVADALKKGVLVRPTVCSECGADRKLHGHHDDYAFPLIVRWLCNSCHRRWHSVNGSAPNNKGVSIHLSARMYGRMKIVAERERRRIGGQIEVALREWLAEKEAAK